MHAADMSEQTPEPGAVGWVDITVDDAPALRDFYTHVVGWSPEEVPMGDYRDYSMRDAGAVCALYETPTPGETS